MDLVRSLVTHIGLPETEAKGLAGGLLGLVKNGLASQSGPEAAADLEAQVPEMKAWQAEGDTPPGEPGLSEVLGGLGDSLGGNLGGLLGGVASSAGLAGSLGALIERFGLDAGKATAAGGLVAQFLESRLGPELLEKARPFLALLGGQGEGSGGSEQGGGLGGLLGGLFR